jgi:hypothetical protein
LEKLGVDISEEEYDSLVSEITATVDTTEGSSFDEYLKVYPDNKWMIEALKEHPVEDVLIYQLKVPLGKSFIIQRDPDYGEYPAIIDEY